MVGRQWRYGEAPMTRPKVVRKSADAAARGAVLVAAMTVLLAAACTANVVAPTVAGAAGSGGTASPAAGRGGSTTTGIGGFPVIDAGAHGGSGPTEDANCGLQNFALDRRPAIVLLLQDRSTSMRNTLSG